MQKFTSKDFSEAYDTSISFVHKKLATEWISTPQAIGRILSKNIYCKKNLPSYDNSAMDGFAVRYEDIQNKLMIKKSIYAGDNIEPCLQQNECYKIMTGAKVPNDADTIVPFELCKEYDKTSVVIANEKIKKGNALRLKGEEQKIGSMLFEKGTAIDAKVSAMLASQGIVMVETYAPLKIAVFSTGDEIQEPWEKANENQIYNVNSSALIALLKEHGFHAEYCGLIPDSLEKSIEYFAKLKSYDAIVTSGGISMGEADFVEKALMENGLKSAFHGINIKPGRPTMIGSMKETLVASMPGNPLAAYINTFLLLIPALKKLQGDKSVYHQCIEVENKEAFKLKPGRTNVVLGSFEDNSFYVFGNNSYGSGMITPLINSNALFVSPHDCAGVEKNQKIKILLFKGLFASNKNFFWEKITKEYKK